MIVNTLIVYVNDEIKRKHYLRDNFEIDGLTKIFNKSIIDTNYEIANKNNINFYLLVSKKNQKLVKHCLKNKNIKIVNSLEQIEDLKTNSLLIYDNFVLNENVFNELSKTKETDIVFFKKSKKVMKDFCVFNLANFKANKFNLNAIFKKTNFKTSHSIEFKEKYGTKLNNFIDLSNYDVNYKENNGCLICTPGPLNIRSIAQASLVESAVHHRSELGKILYKNLAKNILYIFESKKAFPIAMLSTGLGCIESCFQNLTLPNDKAMVLSNGFFGENLVRNAFHYKLDTIVIRKEIGESFDLDEIEEKIKDRKILFMTHLETSTGVLNDVEKISAICKKYNVLLVVDAVSSLINHEFKFDKWNVTAAVGTSTKGLEISPGIAYVCVSQQGMNIAKEVQSQKECTSIYQNWLTFKSRHLLQGFAPSTFPLGLIASFNDAIDDIKERGGIKFQCKYKKAISLYFLNKLMDNGFKSVVKKHQNLSSWLVVLKCPEHISAKHLRSYLYVNFNYLIECGINDSTDKIIRIGIPIDISMNEVNLLIKEIINYCSFIKK